MGKTSAREFNQKAKTPKSKTMGRPTDYVPKIAEIAHNLATYGFSMEKIANILGISTSTLYEWKRTHNDFSQALEGGQAIADSEVSSSLFKMATGFVITVGGEERYIPPNVSAQKSWLTNRQPKLWKEKIDIKEEVDLKVIPHEKLNEIYRKARDEADERDRRIREERKGLVMRS